MFDLAVLERAVDERRAQPRAARRRAPSVRHGPRAGAAPGGAHVRRRAPRRRRRSARSRFVEPERVVAGSRRALRRPGVDARGRTPRGARSSPTSTGPTWRRVAALDGLVAPRRRRAPVVVPARLDRHRAAAARDDPRVVLAPVEPRGVRAHARARRRARPRQARRLPRLGRQDRAHDPRADREGRDRQGAAARRSRSSKARWRPQEFPSMAVSTAFFKLAHDHMLRNWFEHYAEHPAAGIERFFEFEFEGAHGHRLHRPHRPGRAGRLRDHRLQDRQERQRRPAARQPAARHLLPRRAGIARPRGVPAGEDRRARVPARQLEEPRHRPPQVDGHRARRAGLPGGDARAARRADRAQARPERARGLPAEPVRELPVLRLPDALPAVRRGPAGVPGRGRARREAPA